MGVGACSATLFISTVMKNTYQLFNLQGADLNSAWRISVFESLYQRGIGTYHHSLTSNILPKRFLVWNPSKMWWDSGLFLPCTDQVPMSVETRERTIRTCHRWISMRVCQKIPLRCFVNLCSMWPIVEVGSVEPQYRAVFVRYSYPNLPSASHYWRAVLEWNR